MQIQTHYNGHPLTIDFETDTICLHYKDKLIVPSEDKELQGLYQKLRAIQQRYIKVSHDSDHTTSH